MKLTQQQKENLIPQIKRVLETGEEWEDDQIHFPAKAIIDALESIEGLKRDNSDEDTNDGFSFNGWAYDWWQAYTYKGKMYTLTGSGYYGGHSFCLAD